MGFRINTNSNAIDTQRNLAATSVAMASTMRHLSSGLRINSAADDAAGLAISQKLGAQVQGLNQAVRNAQDGISLIQTAEGALNESQSILQRMRELAVQSSSDTNTSGDRMAIQSEVNQLAVELSRISNTTSFNTKNLLAGGFHSQTLQIGANSHESLSFAIGAMDATSLGVAANNVTIQAKHNGANVSAVTNVGAGFNDNVNYSIQSQHLDAGSLTDLSGTANATTAAQNTGNESLVITGTYTGSTATNYLFKVAALDTNGTAVAAMQYSTDGGATWAAATTAAQGDGTLHFKVQLSSNGGPTGSGGDSGYDLSIVTPTNTAGPAVGDQFTYDAGGGANFTTATALSEADGTYVNGTGGTPAGPSATIQGTYTGPYTGAIRVNTNMLNVAGGTNIWDPGTALTVQIGSTTLDVGQYAVDTNANTLSFFGLTMTIAGGTGGSTGGSGNNGDVTFSASGSLAVGGTGNPSTNAAVTVGNTSGVFAPTATATVSQTGSGAAGLGYGSLLLQINQYGANSTDPYGINNVAWVPSGTTTPATYLANDFSYNAGAGADTYTAGAVYSGSLSVTGADGNNYTIAVTNANNGGATVTISDGSRSYGSYTVATTNAGGATPNDVVALNFIKPISGPIAGKNIGRESATISGTFTGNTDTQFLAKVAGLDANGNTTQIQLSTNGGKTYGDVIAAQNYPGGAYPANSVTSFDLQNGLTFTVQPGQRGQNNAVVGDNFAFVATATTSNGGKGATLLAEQYVTDALTYTIGQGQLIQNGQTSAVLGASDLHLTANFGAPGTTSALTAGATIVTTQAAHSAIFGKDGAMLTQASNTAGIDVTTRDDASAAIGVIDQAINSVSLVRAQLGAIQNRLQHTISNLSVGSENLNAAESRIVDVDVASDTVGMTRDNILSQAGISVLAQANQMPSMVLKLLS